MLRSILHCDMNNFYASVECMLDPALKKYPIAVCGSVEERHGIIIVGRMQIAKGVMYMPRHSMSFATKRSRLKKIKKTA